MIRILPQGVEYARLKRASVLFNLDGEHLLTRQLFMIGGLADMIAREACRDNAHLEGAIAFAEGGLHVVTTRLDAITRAFVGEVYGERPVL